MIVSLKWLSGYVDTSSLPVEAIAEGLTMAGLEVEACAPRYPYLKGVVTVRIEEVRPHPQADRLSLCRVSDGKRSWQVVCGAPNVRAGAVAPLALPGATLPGGTLLQEAVVRGETSQGMLCSQKELVLGEDASGIWLLPEGTRVGETLDCALGLEDFLLEVSITPNRGDCLSMIGIAREVAALAGKAVKYPSSAVSETGPPVESITSVTIDDPVGCPRYTARVIRGVKIGPSPGWLCERIEAAGLRPINNVVDVTNYIMMELGQPLHAFDFDRLREKRIVVRRAGEGERFTTLDGVERTLFDDTVLICDGAGTVAVGGIMGGLDSEIGPETANVLIESAYFQPVSIRRSSRKLGLRSESSYRFERGIDPDGVTRALDRAAKLMQEAAGGEIATGRIDVYPTPIQAPSIPLRIGRTNRFLGSSLSGSEMKEVLERIEMKVEEMDGDTLRVLVPSYRPDITREVDLAEEIARLTGYDRIAVTAPAAPIQETSCDPHLRARQEVKGLLEAAGFFEVINYSFISHESLRKLRYAEEDARLKPIPVKNPLSDDLGVMRTSLIPGVLLTARRNFDYRNENIRIFELSKVFLPKAGEPLPDEPHHLAGIVAGKRIPQTLYGRDEEVDYAEAKGIIEQVLAWFRIEGARFSAEALPPYFDPAMAASVFIGEERAGAVGRLHPEVQKAFDLKKPVFVFEAEFDKLFAAIGPSPFFRSLPKFPAVTRDLALAAGEDLPVQQPLDFISGLGEPLLEQIEIFDIFRREQLGAGKKSIGYRLTYRAVGRSLTDEEVNEVHHAITEKVTTAFGVTLR